MPSKKEARRQAAKANHPSTWKLTSREHPTKIGRVAIRATDGVRVLNVDVPADQVEGFDPDATWALIVGNSVKLVTR